MGEIPIVGVQELLAEGLLARSLSQALEAEAQSRYQVVRSRERRSRSQVLKLVRVLVGR